MLSQGLIYRFLWKYHAIHHLRKGSKYNYNIVLPGFDLLMGTFHAFYYDNNAYCKTHHDERCLEKQIKILDNKDVL